jgi:hypothetical protein
MTRKEGIKISFNAAVPAKEEIAVKFQVLGQAE